MPIYNGLRNVRRGIGCHSLFRRGVERSIPESLSAAGRKWRQLQPEQAWFYGTTRNFLLLFRVPLDVVTVTKPVVAPLGTVAVR